MANTGESFRDHLRDGEALHRSVVDVCSQMEKLGWVVKVRNARGFRYWCLCSREHSVWIDTAAITDERLEFLMRTTCLTFN